MKLDDEIRLNILDALLKPGSVGANIRQIQKYTGYHKATIKSSLDFFANEKLLNGYGPKVDFKKFGYKLEVLSFFQADLTMKDTLQRFLKDVNSDPNMYFLSGVVGSDNWNLVARSIYKDIESYHTEMNKRYFEKIPGIHDFVKNRSIYYVTDPFYKTDSRTNTLIKIVRKSRGYD
ncbi:MAG: hypothetical protein COV47_05460 [Candidatus Diapherotrites archaeon CG11_big_fil_rev_8_21_14_0_20_37_9]|nr:MAG: hypothetical protein COV47_05460 [Candidatus Diapherotrites archaeon CG11_big_fil_rev_8_21_14_0_20_37_9]